MRLDYIDHFAISIKNLQASADWYKQVLGFDIFHRWKTTWMLQRENMKIGLFERPQAGTIDNLDQKIAFQHLAFHVSADEFIDAQVQLGNLGIQYDGPEDTGVAYSIFLSDPDGHLLELTTYYGEDKPASTAAKMLDGCANPARRAINPPVATK